VRQLAAQTVERWVVLTAAHSENWKAAQTDDLAVAPKVAPWETMWVAMMVLSTVAQSVLLLAALSAVPPVAS
jgi:hypothetical protein